MLYFDYAATTPLDPRVADLMCQVLKAENSFGNSASQHALGYLAKEKVETARAIIADFISAEPAEIIFTSGATESINLALKGAANMYQQKGKHIITVATEHKATLDTCAYLEQWGFTITYLPVAKNGLINMDDFLHAIRDDTILVSVMQVNNETGVIQPIEKIANITSARGILLHVDAAQSAGKIPINLQTCPIDLLSLSAHKVYGPKGVGVLFVRKRPRIRLQPLLHGGGQEQKMRAGTLATHQIIGMGEAFKIAKNEMAADYAHILQLRDAFLSLTTVRPEERITLNTDLSISIPHILNVQLIGKEAKTFLSNHSQLLASTASACQGLATGESHVLRAMGLDDEAIRASMRLSFGRFTTMEEVEAVANLVYLK